jgi:tRNA(Arg) A34 adenosine deaminase TadA
MSSIKYCIEKAHSIEASTFQRKVYAVITDKKGKVLAEGQNSYTKTHTFQYECAKKIGNEEKCFLHAEIAAICRLSHQHKEKAYKIYIARASKQNGTLLAAPCAVCQEAISRTSIQVVEYTTKDGSKIVERKTLQEEAFKDSEMNKD